MLPSLCFLALVVAEDATLAPREKGPGLAAEATVPRLLFGGPVGDTVLWDEQHLWLVSRGGLYEIDVCREAPRRVELLRGSRPPRPRKARDTEDELLLASLDEADWDDVVLEDFRDDEGLPAEGSFRHRATPLSLGVPVVLTVVRKATELEVVTTEGPWVCQPDRAFCRARASRGLTLPEMPQRRSVPARDESGQAREEEPPPRGARSAPRGDEPQRWETSWGVWFVNDQGVWFDARETTEGACAPFRDQEGSVPFTRPSPPVTLGPTWLPRVSLLGARDLRRAGDRTRAATTVILLLTFSAAPGLRSFGTFERSLGFPE